MRDDALATVESGSNGGIAAAIRRDKVFANRRDGDLSKASGQVDLGADPVLAMMTEYIMGECGDRRPSGTAKE